MVNLVKASQRNIEKADELLISKHLAFEQCAWQSGFYQKQPRKITASSLFFGFWKMQQLGKNSLRKWCIQLSEQNNNLVNKQSLNERLNEKSVRMAELVLQNALNIKRSTTGWSQDKRRLKKPLLLFNRILIRDSTTQNLPRHLSDVFPGNYSRGHTTAVMRIQALFNFTDEKWEQFQIKSYRDNDQGAAGSICEVLEKDDLVLQDLGYFTLDWLEQLIENQFVITKWDNKTHLFTDKNEKIDLLKLLKGKKEVDIPVLVGSQKKLPMRLVARKLPKTKAAKRIKIAKKDRHARAKHSKQYYDLLHYEIYLTNVPSEKLRGKCIAKLYGLRWYIETLFKSWKSYANFKKMFDKHRMQIHRAKFTIYALLIEFVYLMSTIYRYVKKQIKGLTKQQISILKFIEEMNDTLAKIIHLKSLKELLPRIPIYAKAITYEKHSKRKNTKQKYLYVNELCKSAF